MLAMSISDKGKQKVVGMHFSSGLHIDLLTLTIQTLQALIIQIPAMLQTPKPNQKLNRPVNLTKK